MYKLTQQADADLKAIYLRSYDLFGMAQADDYAAGMQKVFQFLAEFPRAARLRTESRKDIRAHPYKSHLIVYLIEGDDIVIARIRHAHEDWISDPI